MLQALLFGRPEWKLHNLPHPARLQRTRGPRAGFFPSATEQPKEALNLALNPRHLLCRTGQMDSFAGRPIRTAMGRAFY